MLFHDVVDNDVGAYIPAGILRRNREHVKSPDREVKLASAGDHTIGIGAAATSVV